MKIVEFRKDLKLSQEQFAQLVGLKSKASVSEIEAKNRCAPRIALEIERLSAGAICAAEISSTVALVRDNAA